jgi:hypothetical protein
MHQVLRQHIFPKHLGEILEKIINNDEREWGMSSCDDPQRLRHAHVLSIIYLFIHLYLASIFAYNILLEIT